MNIFSISTFNSSKNSDTWNTGREDGKTVCKRERVFLSHWLLCFVVSNLLFYPLDELQVENWKLCGTKFKAKNTSYVRHLS